MFQWDTLQTKLAAWVAWLKCDFFIFLFIYFGLSEWWTSKMAPVMAPLYLWELISVPFSNRNTSPFLSLLTFIQHEVAPNNPFQDDNLWVSLTFWKVASFRLKNTAVREEYLFKERKGEFDKDVKMNRRFIHFKERCIHFNQSQTHTSIQEYI